MRVRYFKFKDAGHRIYKSAWHFISIVCDVFGRIELCGYENIPNKPCIIVSNHVSYLDPFSVAFFHETELCAVARDTLMDGKFSGFIFRNMNAIPIKRGSSANIGTFRQILSRAESGCGVIIFPEGTRSPDGELQAGKPGAGLLAIKAGIPIVPMRSFGMYDVLPRSNVLDGGGRIFLCAGKPIYPEEIDPGKDCHDRAQVIVDRIMDRIAQIRPPSLKEI